MHETTLPNGLKVLVQENHASRVVAVQIWVRVGSADEREDEAGLAHVHEHMLFKGTDKRAVGVIANEIESSGGDINAWTSYDQTVYHVTMASRDFDVGLDVLSDAVQHSAFDSDELAKELEVVLEEVSRGKDMPGRVVFENLFSTAFTKHPYSRPVIGYVESVKSFTRPKILDFYKRWYRPKNMCLVVCGDVTTDAVIARAEQLFDADPGGDLPARPRIEEPRQVGLRCKRATKDIQETHLGMAWHGTRLRDDNTPALDVLSILLGSGESSRLYQRVKRGQQLVNDCYASSYTPQDPGAILVGANVHGGGVEEAYRALLQETFRLRYEAPTQAEVDKAKTILLSDAVYQKETVQGIARKMGFFELVAGNPNYEDDYYAGVRDVSVDDVRRVAEQYLRPDGMTVSTLLPDEQADAMAEDRIAAIADQVDAEMRSGGGSAVELGAEQVAKVRLANGSTLLVREDRAVPLVSIRIASQGGLRAETPANNGVTHLAGELLVRGTSRFTAEQLAEETDSTASGITGVSGKNSLGMRGDFLIEHFKRGFELFSSCLLDATFEPEELERERKTQIEDIASRQDSLSSVAFENMAATMWSEHPYRMPILGTKESVASLTREDIIDAVRMQLNPEKLVITVVGAVDIASTIAMIDARIGAAKAHADAKPFVGPSIEPVHEGVREIRLSKNREQAHLVLAFPGVSMADERRWPLEVLSTILGGQGGRLFLELRDKLSLAYSVTAFSHEGVDPGYFAVYMGTSQDKLQTADAGIRRELDKVLEHGVEDREVDRARRYLIGTHEIALQRASARSGAMALNEAYGLGYDSYAKYADQINGVTAARVHEVAREIIRYDRSVLSVVEAKAEASDAK